MHSTVAKAANEASAQECQKYDNQTIDNTWFQGCRSAGWCQVSTDNTKANCKKAKEQVEKDTVTQKNQEAVDKVNADIQKTIGEICQKTQKEPNGRLNDWAYNNCLESTKNDYSNQCQGVVERTVNECIRDKAIAKLAELNNTTPEFPNDGPSSVTSQPQAATSGECGDFSFGSANPDCTIKGDDVAETATNCRIDGVGWLVCPLANYIAKASDTFYDLIVDLLEIPSDKIFDNTKSAFAAYRNFLPLANIILAILFVLIIYSEATGNGFGALSNYSVKKLLPRLVIFAILVNVSWYLCAAAVDISNILGANIVKFFTDTSYKISQDRGKSSFWDGSGIAGANWASIVLAITVGMKQLVNSTPFITTLKDAATAGMAIIGPLLAVVAVVLVVAWLILIIRQAAVIILSITAPIAISMGMLPNTKKAYDKWLSTFFGMLIVWPAIGLIIGGANITSSIMDSSSSALWNGGHPIQATAMAIASVASRSIPLIAIPFVLLNSLKLFGKLGIMLGRMGQSRIKGTNRWAKKSAGREVNTGFNRYMRKRLQSRPDPSKQGRFRRFVGQFTIPALYQKSYENKQAATETNQTVQNKLADNYEKKVQQKGSPQQQIRARAIEAGLQNETNKAFSEQMKQKQIATNPVMKDMNNKKLAYKASSEQYKIKQYDSFVKALQAEQGIGSLSTIATTATVPGQKPVRPRGISGLFPLGNKGNSARTQSTTQPGAAGRVVRSDRSSSTQGAPLPNVPSTPTISTGPSSLPVGDALASALASQKKNNNSNKKARQTYLQQKYGGPEKLANAINNGDITSDVEIEAAVDLIHDAGEGGNQTSAAVTAYNSLLSNTKTMQKHASVITRSALSSKALKEADTAMWMGVRDYNKPVSDGGSGGVGAIDHKSAFASHTPELLATDAKVAGKWNEQMWKDASDINNDTTMEFSNLATDVLSASSSSLKGDIKKAATATKDKGRVIAIDRSKDSEYMSNPENVEKISTHRAVQETDPTIAWAAKMKTESHQVGAVTDQDRVNAGYYHYNETYGGKKPAKFSNDEIKVHTRVTELHINRGEKVESHNISWGSGEPDSSNGERAILLDEHDKTIANALKKRVETDGINENNAGMISSSRIIDHDSWSLGKISREICDGKRTPIKAADIVGERRKYSLGFLSSQRKAALDFVAGTGRQDGFKAGEVAKAIRDVKSVGGVIDKETHDALVRVKQKMHNEPMTYSDEFDESNWKKFDSEVK